MFKLIHFTLLSTKWAHLKKVSAAGLKKVGTGAEQARHFEKIQLGEHLATN